MEKLPEHKFESHEIEFEDTAEYFEKSTYMSPEDALHFLAKKKPEFLHKFYPELIRYDIERLNSEEFRSSDEYKKLINSLDIVNNHNLKTAETIKINVIPVVVYEVLKYVRGMWVDFVIPANNLKEFTNALGMIVLSDLIYEAEKIKGGVNDDYGGLYHPLRNTIVVRDRPEFKGKFKVGATISVVLHELIHALSYKNFWIINRGEQAINTEESVGFRPRRLGINSTRPNDSISRLNRLNEAITHRLTMKILEKVLDQFNIPEEVKKEVMLRNNFIYNKERDVLKAMTEEIDWKYFIDAYFTKMGLVNLGRKTKEVFGNTLSEISLSMDSEYQEGGAKHNGYIKTKEMLFKNLADYNSI
ncbi:MAG: hypothetical protein A2586_02585 [Candidatus Harrisonbacteria bacterium RIFOXYD1_FULL_40_9]|uniref:Uncharacterized protein n=1 Tax=Candidatus Harrisonbacteria bacterium RIFOXYD1_FULL_40_9 TaxID=1798412 RepID=A0A1G1ZY52_9BACT|nr:MAG: hypothetical protein A2586_02585 [Candidatus Harrisonbacteria bacterium RIFOXYD1_FULL_40_9]